MYKKIVEGFEKNKIDLGEFRKGLINFRISKSECLIVAKDLELFGLVDVKINGNQHTKIKLKAYANFLGPVIFLTPFLLGLLALITL